MLQKLWIALITAVLAGAPNVEYIEGVCKDADTGAGVVLYSSMEPEGTDPDYDCISYDGTGAETGDIVYTVIVYDGPANEAEDKYILIVDMTETGLITIR